MRLMITGMAVATMACAAVPPQEPPLVVADGGSTCSTEQLGSLLGRAAGGDLGAEALRLSGARALRWIRPGDAVTMDYREDRLNVHLDSRDRVERFACG